MALSNIFREPRREITESVIGIIPLALFLYADYQFALWFHEITGGNKDGCPVFLSLFVGIFGLVAFVLVLNVTHALGERLCDSLADRGLELRPKRRSH